MAKITIFSTKGSSKKVHETEATTWGELQNEISESYDFSNLQATENVNRTDLVSSSAVLPKGDFTLFLRPIKTKSGAFTYTEARDIIKGDKVLQEYIKTVYGKNYTNLTTSTLNEAIQNHNPEEDDDDSDYDNVEEVESYDSSADEIKEDINNLIEKLEAFKEKLSGNSFIGNSIGVEDSIDEEIEELKREAREIFGE